MDADSSLGSQEEIKDTKGILNKSYVKTQLSFQLMVHVGAHSVLCAKASCLPKISPQFCSPEQMRGGLSLSGCDLPMLIAKHSPSKAAGFSGAQSLCCHTTSITNHFDLRLEFQPQSWIPLTYMFKTTE